MRHKNIPKSKKTTVSLEIGDRFIKLTEIRFFRHERISRFISKRIPTTEDTAISQEIRGLFLLLGITQKRVLLNIPRGFLIARFLHLPSTSENEIKDIIAMESAKQMPYAAEEILYDYRIIRKLKDGYSDVLLAMAQKKIIDRLINIIRGANLSVEKIAISSESLFSWVSLFAPQPGTAAVVNVDCEYIDIIITENGNIAFARSFSYDDNEKTNAINEIKKSITIFQKEKNFIVDKIIVSGAKKLVKDLEPVLRENIDTPLEIIDQTKNIQFTKAEDSQIHINETSFIGLIGLVLKNEDIKINLLPENIKDEIKLNILKKYLVKTAIILLCIMIFFSGIIIKKISNKLHYLAYLDSEIKKMEPKVNVAKRMKKDIILIREEIYKASLAADFLAEIYKITPQGITFNMIDYQSNKVLLLRGNASSFDQVIKFISILEDSQYFQNAKMKYTSKRTIKGKQATNFEIICMLTK